MGIKIFEKEHRKKTILLIVIAAIITTLITILIMFSPNIFISDNTGGGT